LGGRDGLGGSRRKKGEQGIEKKRPWVEKIPKQRSSQGDGKWGKEKKGDD